MNIFKKKIVKEKEFIFNEVCSQSKSIYPNSKQENNWDIKSHINIRQFYGINSKQLKNEKIIKNNRHNRSKSLIITNKDKCIPKEIKTVLIKLNKPLERINNNYIDSSKNKTYYTNDFYSTKNINNIINENKTIEYQPYINNRQNLINFDNHYENIKNYNINLLSLYAPRQRNHKMHKLTRNKSVILNNEIKHDNISIYSSFNTIYKKSYCLDKHKNYGGNFKNKERCKTNSYIKLTKNNNHENKNKKILIKNVSAPNIFNIMNVQNSLGCNIFNNKNDNIGKMNNNQIKDDVNDVEDKKVNIDKESFLKVELCENKDEIDEIKNKLKIKNIPQLDFKDNIRNSTTNIDIDSKDNFYKGFINRNRQKKYNNTNLISLNKCKNANIMAFEESMNDMYSMRNKKNNKGNLINIISISEQETKREEQNNSHKKDKRDNYVNNWDNNKSKSKIKKDNNNKISIKKNKIKRKGKMFRENNAKKIEIENNPYNININNMNRIKSIPLKFKNVNDLYLHSQNYCNKNINNSRNYGYNILNNNKINTNVIIINDKDFNLWNDLTHIYNFNGK